MPVEVSEFNTISTGLLFVPNSTSTNSVDLELATWEMPMFRNIARLRALPAVAKTFTPCNPKI